MIQAKMALPFARRQGFEVWFRKIAREAGFSIGNRASTLPALQARVNHGRWLVDCPYDNGAELVDTSEPIFLCLSCGNVFSGGLPVRVSFPINMTQIEAALASRPRANQNWLPGETLAELVAENIAFRVGG